MTEEFTRTKMLLDGAAMEKLSKARAAINPRCMVRKHEVPIIFTLHIPNT